MRTLEHFLNEEIKDLNQRCGNGKSMENSYFVVQNYVIDKDERFKKVKSTI